jgi:hypothetical protein
MTTGRINQVSVFSLGEPATGAEAPENEGYGETGTPMSSVRGRQSALKNLPPPDSSGCVRRPHRPARGVWPGRP